MAFPEYEPFASVIKGMTLVKVVGIITLVYAVIRHIKSGDQIFPTHSLTMKWLVLFFIALYTLHFSWDIFYFWGMHAALLYICLVFVTSLEVIRKVFWAVVLGLLANAYLVVKSVILYGNRWSIRAEGVFGDPNYFAIALLIGLAFSIGLMRLYYPKRQFMWSTILLLLGFSLFKTGSRGGFLGFLVMAASYILSREKKIKAVIIGIAILLPTIHFLAPNVIYRFTGHSKGDEGSTHTRWELQIAGLNMIKAHPFLGIGYGNFKSVAPMYNPKLTRGQIAHNTYMQVAAELGLPIFIIYALILLASIRDLLRLTQISNLIKKKEELRIISESLLAGFLGYSCSILFLTAEREKYLWLTIFLIICSKRIVTKDLVRVHSAYKHL